MTQSLLERLRKTLKGRKSGRIGQGLREAIDFALQYVDSGGMAVWEPDKISAGYSSPVGILEYFMCPKCGKILDVSAAVKDDFKCKCGSDLVQAYVGAPIDYGSQLHPYQIGASGGSSQNALIASVKDIPGIHCYRGHGLKGLRPEDPNWPVLSLRFSCPYNDIGCPHYRAGGWCDHYDKGRKYIVFPQMRGGGRRIPVLPSEGLTKSFAATVFDRLRCEDVSGDLGFSDLGRVCYGRFMVWHLTLFYMVGSPYAPMGGRRAVAVIDGSGRLVAAGRKMEVEGILFELDFARVKQASQASGAKPYTVVHSVSHAIMKAVVRVTGLSHHEFGEAVYVDAGEGKAEVLIYDDSPGGVGGVKAFKGAGADACCRIRGAAAGCPRACMRACRACLFLENCSELNYNLSWRAAQHYLAGLGCPGCPA